MHSFVTSKNVKWCHLIWPTLYMECLHLNKETYLLTPAVRSDYNKYIAPIGLDDKTLHC